jgi:hypothetical protein
LAFYDLRPFAEAYRARVGAAAAAALGKATLHPVALTYGEGFNGVEGQGSSRWRWMGQQATLQLDNRYDARDVVVSIAILKAERPSNLTVRWPDGEVQTVRVGSRDTSVRRRLRLASGQHVITLATDSQGPTTRTAGDNRDLRLQVRDPVLVTDPGAFRASSPSG